MNPKLAGSTHHAAAARAVVSSSVPQKCVGGKGKDKQGIVKLMHDAGEDKRSKPMGSGVVVNKNKDQTVTASETPAVFLEKKTRKC